MATIGPITTKESIDFIVEAHAGKGDPETGKYAPGSPYRVAELDSYRIRPGEPRSYRVEITGTAENGFGIEFISTEPDYIIDI